MLGVENETPEADMAESEPVEITWHRNRPGQFQLIHNRAPLERKPGGREEAQELADSLGFILVTNEDHLARWVRHPRSLKVEE